MTTLEQSLRRVFWRSVAGVLKPSHCSRPARLGLFWIPLGWTLIVAILLLKAALLVTLRTLYVIVYVLGEL